MSEDLFEMYRGDDYALSLNITDEQDPPQPIDITGWKFWATMKLSTEMTDEEAPVKVDIPEIVAGSTGLVNILLPAAQTKALLPTRYQFDIQCERDGLITTVTAGPVLVKGDVTWRDA